MNINLLIAMKDTQPEVRQCFNVSRGGTQSSCTTTHSLTHSLSAMHLLINSASFTWNVACCCYYAGE